MVSRNCEADSFSVFRSLCGSRHSRKNGIPRTRTNELCQAFSGQLSKNVCTKTKADTRCQITSAAMARHLMRICVKSAFAAFHQGLAVRRYAGALSAAGGSAWALAPAWTPGCWPAALVWHGHAWSSADLANGLHLRCCAEPGGRYR